MCSVSSFPFVLLIKHGGNLTWKACTRSIKSAQLNNFYIFLLVSPFLLFHFSCWTALGSLHWRMVMTIVRQCNSLTFSCFYSQDTYLKCKNHFLCNTNRLKSNTASVSLSSIFVNFNRVVYISWTFCVIHRESWWIILVVAHSTS